MNMNFDVPYEDMVRGARSSSSFRRRLSSGRGSFAASASGPSSVPPPLATGMLGSVYASSSYDSRLGSVYTSSFYGSRLGSVYASSSYSSRNLHNYKDKMEPAQPYQFITRSIQAHFPGPIHRFNDFPMDVQELLYQMFMARSRSVWTTTARSNFKHLLYNARKNTHRVCQSPNPALWRERAPIWMRRDYWQGLCNIWAAERWQETSTIMKVNRATNPEANKHTSGSVSFATHQYRLEKELKRPPTFQEDQYISNRAQEVALYSQQMIEKYPGEEQSQLNPEVWFAASGAPKKGHVYGFGHSMDTSRVLSGASNSGSQATSAFTTPGTPGTSPSEMMGFI
ncbi:hypothetical protein Taro_026981 [Colocasia esculenta]|uniref:Uncharacterized protein n=1 Tax=Colocasia esculenta TaxID=4460 RepID=A0A843VGR3_COLES|nr:hypothetical protein [Colocasia esculenta]